jgi:hypothetical protein
MPTLFRRSPVAASAATLAVVLAAAVVPEACARAGTLARVDLYDRNAGQALPIHRHRGRHYVEGRPGNEYAVRIRNCTGERLLAVLSVDGVNAVTGETASPDQSGYVIEPWGYVTVQGWRKDLDGTAAFYFSDPQDAYASRTGRPDDLGVIGVALFRERPQPTHWLDGPQEGRVAGVHPPAREKAESSGATAESGAATDASASAPAPSSQRLPSLGTGHGRREYAPVERVQFERARSRPDERIAIRYERRETLVAMGVLPDWQDDWHEPEPFPGALGFVPDP